MSRRDEIIKKALEQMMADFKDLGKPAPDIGLMLYHVFNSAIEEVRREFYRRYENTDEKRSAEFYENAPMWVLDFLDSLTEEKP